MYIRFEPWILRIGGVAAILGSLFAAVGNLLHPVTPRHDPEGVAQVIAQSEHWTLIHWNTSRLARSALPLASPRN